MGDMILYEIDGIGEIHLINIGKNLVSIRWMYYWWIHFRNAKMLRIQGAHVCTGCRLY